MKKIILKPKFKNNIGTDAFTDWGILLAVSFLIAIFLIGIGSYVYINTQTDLEMRVTPSVTNNKPSFDTQLLKKVVGTFDARANERVLLSKGYVGPSDPSLP